MNWLSELWQRLRTNDQVILSVLAIGVGLAAGYGSIGFRLVIAELQFFLFGDGGEQLATIARALPAWQIVLVPTLGGLLVGIIVAYVLPGKVPAGVPDVIEAAALHSGRMSLRNSLAATALSAGSIACGASVGREGPIVHLGAAIGSYVARYVDLNAPLTRTLLGCGTAAGVAAAFNAPIAGVFFALEVVVGHYGLGAFSPVVLASVMGTMISRIHFGEDVAFVVSETGITSFWEMPAFLLLGLLCGGVAVGMMRGVGLVQQAHDRLATPKVLRPVLAGLVVGLLAISYPEILGVGYEATDNALHGHYALHLLIVLAILKAAASCLCLGSLFGGGWFSPALFVGAMVGGAFGIVAGGIFPALASSPATYALIGMGAVAGSVLGAPISTTIMIFELTSNYGVAFALMVSTAVAAVLSKEVFGHSVFTYMLELRGISLSRSRDRALIQHRRVIDVMRTDHQAVAKDTSLHEVGERLRRSLAPVYVSDSEGTFVGTIAFDDFLQATSGEGIEKPPRNAGELARRPRASLRVDDNLMRALQLFESSGETQLPVVDTRKPPRVVGRLNHRDVLLVYNQALLHARAIERGDD